MPFIAPRVTRPKTTYPLAKRLFTYSEIKIFNFNDVCYNITMNTDFVCYISDEVVVD